MKWATKLTVIFGPPFRGERSMQVDAERTMERDAERMERNAASSMEGRPSRRPRTAAEHITQRWSRPLFGAASATTAEERSAKAHTANATPLVNRARLCGECALLLFVLLWLATLALLYTSRAQGCHVFSAASGGGARVYP